MNQSEKSSIANYAKPEILAHLAKAPDGEEFAELSISGTSCTGEPAANMSSTYSNKSSIFVNPDSAICGWAFIPNVT